MKHLIHDVGEGLAYMLTPICVAALFLLAAILGWSATIGTALITVHLWSAAFQQ